MLGRLRFLLQCSECFRRARALPAALCYVPREVQYKICKDPAAATAAAAARSLLSVWDSPGPARGGKRAARATIEVRKGGCLRATGEEYCNGAGLWVKLSKVTGSAAGPFCVCVCVSPLPWWSLRWRSPKYVFFHAGAAGRVQERL